MKYIKRFISAWLLILVCIGSVNAQQKGPNGFLGFRTGVFSLNGNKDFMPYDFTLGLGYNFTPRFYVEVQTDLAISLFEKGGLQSYYTDSTLGGGLGYYVYKSGDGFGNLAVVASAGSTLGGQDWRYMYLDGGLRCNAANLPIRMSLGVGVRYYNSYNDAFANGFRFYVSVGFRIN